MDVNLCSGRWAKGCRESQSRVRGTGMGGQEVGLIRGGFPEEVMCELSPEGSEEVSHAGVWGRAL